MQQQGQFHIAQRRQEGHQIAALKDDTDGLGPPAGHGAVAAPRLLAAVDVDRPRIRRVQSGNQVQQGRFPGTRRPHQGHEFTPGNLQGDALKRGHAQCPLAVGFAHLLEGDIQGALVGLSLLSAQGGSARLIAAQQRIDPEPGLEVGPGAGLRRQQNIDRARAAVRDRRDPRHRA